MLSTGLDSGSSWVAAFSCSVMTLLLLTPLRIKGMLYVVIIEQFQTDRQTASYPSVVMMFLRGMGGPIIGYLGVKFGVYRITLIGCICGALGIGLCFFATSVGQTTFFIGWFYGLGMAFGNALIPQILKYHFEKYLVTSLGLFMAGASLGGVVLPPIAEHLFFEYGPSGTYLLISAIMLHAIPACMLVRAMNVGTRYIEPKFCRGSLCSHSGKKLKISNREEPITVYCTQSNESRTHQNEENVGVHCDFSFAPQNTNISVTDGANNTTENGEPIMAAEESKIQTTENSKNPSDSVSVTKAGFVELNAATLETSTQDRTGNISYEKKVVGKSSSKVLKEPKNSWTVFLDPTFYIVMVNTSMVSSVSALSTTTMVDFARDKNIDSSYEVWLFVILSLAELFGFVGLGWMTDRGYLSRISFATICSTMVAVGCLAVVAARSFALMVCGLSAITLFAATTLTLLSRIMCGIIEGDRLTIGLASRQFLLTPILLSGSSLIGYFRVSHGSYDGLYYLFATASVVCGLFILLIPYCARRKQIDLKKNPQKGNS